MRRAVRVACHAVPVAAVLALLAIAAVGNSPAGFVTAPARRAPATDPVGGNGPAPDDQPTFGTAVISRIQRLPTMPLDPSSPDPGFHPLTGMDFQLGWGNPDPTPGQATTTSASRLGTSLPEPATVIGLAALALAGAAARRGRRRRARPADAVDVAPPSDPEDGPETAVEGTSNQPQDSDAPPADIPGPRSGIAHLATTGRVPAAPSHRMVRPRQPQTTAGGRSAAPRPLPAASPPSSFVTWSPTPPRTARRLAAGAPRRGTPQPAPPSSRVVLYTKTDWG